MGPNPTDEHVREAKQVGDAIAAFLAAGGTITNCAIGSATPAWTGSRKALDMRTIPVPADDALRCEQAIRQGRIRAWLFNGELRLERRSYLKWLETHG